MKKYTGVIVVFLSAAFFGVPGYSAVLMDLHTHSYCSDGLKSPEEMVELAKKAGMVYYALSDHDTTACLARARDKANEVGINFIPAIEVSAEDDSMHILGLNINPDAPSIQALVAASSAERTKRMVSILHKLAEMDVHLDTRGDVLLPKLNEQRRKEGLPPLKLDKSVSADMLASGIRGSISRPDIANALVSRGYARDFRDAFDKYLGDRAPASVPMQGAGFREVIKAIHDAGGIAILAHPYTIYKFKRFPMVYSGKKYESFAQLAGDMMEAGLDGYEIYKPKLFREDISFIKKIAADWRAKTGKIMFFTPGSDYHGAADGGPGPRGMMASPIPEEDEQFLLYAIDRN